MKHAPTIGLGIVLTMLCGNARAAADLSFDLSAYTAPSPFELYGYAELRQEYQSLDADSPLYRLNFADSGRDALNRSIAAVELSGSYRNGDSRIAGTWHGEQQHDELADHGAGRLYELYLAHQPDAGTTVELGKRAVKWGKGYAWNPVGFIERPKDPNDPELSREGYVIAAADFIHTRGGDLHTIAFTPVLLPVTAAVNDDFGPETGLNAAAKLYLLYRDIDIDLLWLSGGSRPGRVGLDFSTNLAPNLEVHGEYAYIHDHEQKVLDAGTMTTRRYDAHSWLLGLRYLNERETTWIVEYYHDDRGYSEAQMQDFLSRVDAAAEAMLPQLRSIGQAGYTRPAAMQDYLYLRVAQKDPFDILYLTPALTAIGNLDDGSWSLTPELLYTGIDDLELRLRATLLHGARLSEFGAKPNDSKVELRLRYSF
jgi:hypothetical protein